MCVFRVAISPAFKQFFTLCWAPMTPVLMIHRLCSQEACLLPQTREHMHATRLRRAGPGPAFPCRP